MAEQNKTQIALELERIVGAKRALGQKATDMGLVYVNPEDDDDRKVVTADDPIHEIAVVYQDIDVYTQKDAEHTGHNIVGKTVNLSEGYYTQQSMSVKDGSVSTPTVSINNDSGLLSVDVKVSEGYVGTGNRPVSMYLNDSDEFPNLSAENIKADVKLFGVTGTFTSDANVPTTGTGEVLESSHITKDFIAYKNGKKVIGTLENSEGPEQYNNFNPLEKGSWVLEGPVRIGGSLTVGLSDDLLNALKAI